jgi:DNA polymerase III subunit delta'
MSLPPLVGHDEVRRALAAALAADRLPGSLLLHGPAGVGRQRLGLWLGQRIVCTQPQDIEPCGSCQPCVLSLRLQHPEIHWFFPIPRPKATGGGERMIDAVEEARALELAARREDPFHRPGAGEPVGLYLAQVQAIRRLASSRPAVGSRRVILIGDAELLVPQESSPEAANALLKLLEEPPSGTTLVLTAAAPDSLLPTIRSRLLPVRLRPLPLPAIADFLIHQCDTAPDRARILAAMSAGSLGRALRFLGEGDDVDAPRERARRCLAAALTAGRLPRLALAHATPVAGARAGLTETLDLLELWLRDLAAVAAGVEDVVVNQDALSFLRTEAQRHPAAGAGLAAALRALDEGRGAARNNVNPQLTLLRVLRGVNQALAVG